MARNSPPLPVNASPIVLHHRIDLPPDLVLLKKPWTFFGRTSGGVSLDLLNGIGQWISVKAMVGGGM